MDILAREVYCGRCKNYSFMVGLDREVCNHCYNMLYPSKNDSLVGSGNIKPFVQVDGNKYHECPSYLIPPSLTPPIGTSYEQAKENIEKYETALLKEKLLYCDKEGEK